MERLIILHFAVMFFCNVIYSQDKLLLMRTDSVFNSLKKIKGEVNMDVIGNKSDKREFFRIASGFKLDQGVYPYEVNILSRFETQVSDGKLVEKVNEIDISFDYHPVNIGNGRFLEFYAFAYHFSDEYLGIETKYELGWGGIVSYWSKNVNSSGVRLKNLMGNIAELTKINLKNAVDTLDKDNIPEKTAEKIYAISQTNIKNYSKWRLALLFGIFYELEHVALTDSFIDMPHDFFAASSYIKWQIRPTLEFHPGDIFSIRISPYVKMPFEKMRDEYLNKDMTVEKRLNYFVYFPVYCDFKLNEGITLSFEYRLYYDNIPKQRIFNLDDNKLLVSVSNFHHHVNSKICFSF